MQKRGYFFTLDAITAIGVMVVGIVIVLLSLSYQPSESQVITLSQDLVNAIYATRLYDLNDQDYPYMKYLKSSGNVTNMENSVLEQFGEFYYRNVTYKCQFCLGLASGLASNLTRYSVPEQYSFEIIVNNISLYERRSTNPASSTEKNSSRLLMTSRRVFSGFMNRTDMWGPYTAEVIVWQ